MDVRYRVVLYSIKRGQVEKYPMAFLGLSMRFVGNLNVSVRYPIPSLITPKFVLLT